MSKRAAPALDIPRRPATVQSYADPRSMKRWNQAIRAASEGDDNIISIYDPIGYDPWTGEGTTSKRVAAALRQIGKREVTVNLNSPGGDVFEGFGIYSLLVDHPGEVTVKVLGLAASAASVIAMAGDTIKISDAAFMMIHNTMVLAMGDRNDLAGVVEVMAQFDRGIAQLYAARTGGGIDDFAALMDKETWFGADDAMARGLADERLPAKEIETEGGDSAEARARHIDPEAWARLRPPECAPAQDMTPLSTELKEFAASLRRHTVNA